MKVEYIIGAIIASLVGIGLMVLYLTPSTDVRPLSTLSDSTEKVPYTEIVNPSGFVNTNGITLQELVGKKVILIDFLTYSCINCQRTFPYINAWYEKYKDQGLEVIGIHTPEFAFEKNIDNVREAMKRFAITHPIVLDNEYATWNAYGNKYWPRKYLIDINGNVVYDHIGEGGYEETEMKIRELLEERAQVLGTAQATDDSLAVDSVPVVRISAQSPETYFGSERNEFLSNGVPGKTGEQTFIAPTIFEPNSLYFNGEWNITPEYAEAVSNAQVVYRYSAKEVYIVAQSADGGTIEIFQDGNPINDAAGSDVSPDGKASIKESRLYTLIQNETPGEHVLELRVSGEVQLFAFTFG